MASYMSNIALGRLHQLILDGADFEVLLLKEIAAQSVIQDLTTVADILANGDTDEADFTNYVRKAASLSRTVNNTDDRIEYSFTNITWENAGGASNNNVTAALLYQDVDTTDANAVPICVLTDGEANWIITNGQDVTISSPAGGFHQTTKSP